MMLYVWTKTKKMVDSGTFGKFAYAIRKYEINYEEKNRMKINEIYFFINTV